MLPMRKMLSTFNFHTTYRPPPNQSYGVDLFTLFFYMDLLNTSHQISRTSKSLSTSWLSISKTNRSIVVRLMISLISMVWVMPSEISFLQSMRLNGTSFTLIKNLTLLGPKSL